MTQRLLCTKAKQDRMNLALSKSIELDLVIVEEHIVPRTTAPKDSPIQVGAWVEHNGSREGKRYHWLGAVLEIDPNGRVTVLWMLDKSGNRIEYINQTYSKEWSSECLTVFRIPKKAVNSYQLQPLPEETVEQPEDDSGSFIVWCKGISNRNPNYIHNSKEAATEEAERLSIKYKKCFHVAKLVVEVSPEVTTIAKVVEL